MEPMPTLYTAHPDGTYREWTPPADPLDGSPRPALACCGSTGTHHSDTCRFKPAEDGDGVTAAEWIDHGIEAANDLSFIYHSNRDGPGGLKVSTVRAHLGAIIAAFEGIRAALAASPDAPRLTPDREALREALNAADTLYWNVTDGHRRRFLPNASVLRAVRRDIDRLRAAVDVPGAASQPVPTEPEEADR